MTTAATTTPRAEKIAEDLLADARAFLREEGCHLHSRAIKALARAVAGHLAALEELMLCGWPQREELLRAGTAVGRLTTPQAPVQAPMKIIQRPDRKDPQGVPESEIRWGTNAKTIKWTLTGSCPLSKNDAAYIRESPSSPWGIRVEILGEGR